MRTGDIEGKVRRSANSGYRTTTSVNLAKKTRYPPITHFNDVKTFPPADVLNKMVSSAFILPLAPTPSPMSGNGWKIYGAPATLNTYGNVTSTNESCSSHDETPITNPLQDISNARLTPRMTEQEGMEAKKDANSSHRPWIDSNTREAEPLGDLIDFTSSSPVKLPTLPEPAEHLDPFPALAEDDWGYVPARRSHVRDPYLVLDIQWGASNDE